MNICKKRALCFIALILLYVFAAFSVLTSCVKTPVPTVTESDTLTSEETDTAEETTGEASSAGSETTTVETEETTAPDTATASDTTKVPETTSSAAAHEHKYGEWKTVKEPTCTEQGQKERTCSCGDKETSSIPTKGHVEVKDNGTAASCKSNGKTDGSHCSVCGKVIKAQETVKALGHDFKDGVCTRCGEKDPTVTKPVTTAESESTAVTETDAPEPPAAGTLDITVEAKKAHAGEQVSVDIKLDNNPGINSLKITISYGDLEYAGAKITYCESSDADIMKKATDKEAAREVILNWVSPEETFTDNGTFATVTFNVPASAAAGVKYALAVRINPNDVFGTDYNNVPFRTVDGSVTVG